MSSLLSHSPFFVTLTRDVSIFIEIFKESAFSFIIDILHCFAFNFIGFFFIFVLSFFLIVLGLLYSSFS